MALFSDLPKLKKGESPFLRVAIVGSIGREDEAKQMSKELYQKMQNIVKKILQERGYQTKDITFVGGGNAFAEHLAVSLFLESSESRLELYLPCTLDQLFGSSSATGIFLVKRHRTFSEKVFFKPNTSLEHLKEAIKRGAQIKEIKEGISERNLYVAQSVDLLIAFTFSSRHDQLKINGGASDVWQKCTLGEKIHISLLDIDSFNSKTAKRPRKEMKKEEAVVVVLPIRIICHLFQWNTALEIARAQCISKSWQLPQEFADPLFRKKYEEEWQDDSKDHPRICPQGPNKTSWKERHKQRQSVLRNMEMGKPLQERKFDVPFVELPFSSEASIFQIGYSDRILYSCSRGWCVAEMSTGKCLAHLTEEMCYCSTSCSSNVFELYNHQKNLFYQIQQENVKRIRTEPAHGWCCEKTWLFDQCILHQIRIGCVHVLVAVDVLTGEQRWENPDCLGQNDGQIDIELNPKLGYIYIVVANQVKTLDMQSGQEMLLTFMCEEPNVGKISWNTQLSRQISLDPKHQCLVVQFDFAIYWLDPKTLLKISKVTTDVVENWFYVHGTFVEELLRDQKRSKLYDKTTGRFLCQVEHPKDLHKQVAVFGPLSHVLLDGTIIDY
jgi:hypothetical protein